MTAAPFDFTRARDASAEASRHQDEAVQEIVTRGRDYAKAEEAYRKALALKMWELHQDDRVAWTVTPDLARGDAHVALLKRQRDEAESLLESARQASFHRSADRRDTERFIEWSMRRDLAEGYGQTNTFGARAA